MKLFRNPEIRKMSFIFFIMTAVLTAVLAVLGKYRMMWVSLGICLVFSAVSVYFAQKRYNSIESLSLQLNKILHGETRLNFDDFSEGELSVLKNQLDKVVLRLREQSDALKAEKVHLTDSIADISHQLRTPMTSINLIISFLKKEELPTEKRMSLVQDLQRLSDRIDWLINALLKISKIDAGTAGFKSEDIQVSTLIKKAAGPLGIPMDLREQTLIVSAAGDEHFSGDISWTAEAIGNILKNCSEHTPHGGRICIDCQQTAIYTQIVIFDNGPGISKDDLPHIFERFYKGKDSSGESVGIGLALARMIIVNQNGTIKAENIPTGGAKFTIKMYHTIV